MKIYLAAPFFTEQECARYEEIVKILRNSGNDVFVPKEHFVPDGENMDNCIWAKHVFDMDVSAIDQADALVVLNWGMYSDSGTAWEQGYAYAKGKPIYSILLDEETFTYSLMMINGCSQIVSVSHFMDPNEAREIIAIQK